MAIAPEPWSRRFGRLVLAGALAGAALALPACGGDDAGSAPPDEPGGNVDANPSTGVGGVIDKAKDTADSAEQRNDRVDSTQP